VTIGSIIAYKVTFGTMAIGIAHGSALIAAEAVLLTGVAILLSVFLTDTLSAVVLFVVFAVGHCIHILPRAYPSFLSKGVSYVLPYLYNFDVKTEISHGVEIPMPFVGMGLLYGVGYALAMTALAVVVFSRKDIS